MARQISVDWENDQVQWWDDARDMAERGCAPHALVPLLEVGGPDAIVVSEAEADQIWQWASFRSGWNGGPAHAAHPLLISDPTQ